MDRAGTALVAVLGLLALPAAAQDFTGTWYGRIEGPVADDYRKLVVAADGARLSCAFVRLEVTSGADSTCATEGGALQLVTFTQNRVRLTASGDALEGTFANGATGRSSHIRMVRDPAQAGIPSGARVAGSYSFGGMQGNAASQTIGARSLSLCGQTVRYSLAGSNSTSAAGSHLGGIWEGERGEPNPQGQEAAVCVGFVVEAVAPDGKIQAVHAWGERMRLLSNGVGIAIQPGVARWPGELVVETAVWKWQDASYALRLSGPDRLRGTYQNRWGKADVWLTRRAPPNR